MNPDEGAALRRQLAFDALALVRQLPLVAQGYMLVKRDTSRVTSLFRSQWLQFWGELRGGMLLFFDPETVHASVGAHARPIQLVFSATKCILDLKNTLSYSQVKLRREDGATLLLRFGEPQEAQNWCALLQTHTVPYTTVRLADFDWITAIGKGASGKVFLVRDNHSNARLALKVIDKTKVFRTQLTFQHVINERLVLEMCVGCPFLIQMRYAFQTDVHLYFATDFYDGGDVFSLLQTNKGRLSERHARRLIAEVVLALAWLHERNIVYRDLKPENVVLDGEGHIRLADFGLAKVLSWPNNQLTQTICGTTAYAAPEMLQSKPYNVTLDLWCLGVFIYHILVGRTPFNFRGRTMEEMEEMQRTRAVRYSSSLSLEAVSLIKSLLQNDPNRRPTLNQVKRHRFFADVDWVRVARKEPHPDGLAQFVGGRSQKESILAKLTTSRTQMSAENISTSTIVPFRLPRNQLRRARQVPSSQHQRGRVAQRQLQRGRGCLRRRRVPRGLEDKGQVLGNVGDRRLGLDLSQRISSPRPRLGFPHGHDLAHYRPTCRVGCIHEPSSLSPGAHVRRTSHQHRPQRSRRRHRPTRTSRVDPRPGSPRQPVPPRASVKSAASRAAAGSCRRRSSRCTRNAAHPLGGTHIRQGPAHCSRHKPARGTSAASSGEDVQVHARAVWSDRASFAYDETAEHRKKERGVHAAAS